MQVKPKERFHLSPEKRGVVKGPRIGIVPGQLFCCGQPMISISDYISEILGKVYWSLDCKACGNMIDVEVMLKQRYSCKRCGNKRCCSDDGHLGDDGGYLP